MDSLTTSGSSGSFGGQFNSPRGIAFDPTTGNFAVADAGNTRIQVFGTPTIPDTDFLLTLGSLGSADGQFDAPTFIAVNTNTGNTAVADTNNHRIQLFDSAGIHLLSFGSFGTADGQFDEPIGVAIDPNTGNIAVADTSNNRIQIFDSAGIHLLTFGSLGSLDGQFDIPQGIAINSNNGNIAVADFGNHRIQIFDSAGCWYPPPIFWLLWNR